MSGISLSGVSANLSQLRTLSNNIANTSTNGFKSSNLLTSSNLNGGVRTQTIQQNFSQGNLSTSSSPLDLAINGGGFFILQDASGNSVSRSGSFFLDKNGFVTNSFNQKLLGFNEVGGGVLQPLQIPNDINSTQISISQEGIITSNNSNGSSTTVGQIALGDVTNPNGLQSQGNNNFTITFASGELLVGSPNTNTLGSIQSGFLEGSNVDLAENFVGLIEAQRSIQANIKVLQATDGIYDSLLNIR